tara:strand:- start:14043 stop:15053 length:1011 start_codon:yes stop_codon:yes gene_type:complete
MNFEELNNLLNDNLSQSLNKRDLLFKTIRIPEEAQGEEILFVGDLKYFKKIQDTSVLESSLCILNEKFFASLEKNQINIPNYLVVKNFESAINKVSKYFYDQVFGELNFQLDGRKLGSAEIHPSADIAEGVFIGEKVKIGKNVKIHPGVVIQPLVTIGDNTEIYPNVSIYPLSEIGSHCRIHSNTTIGADGFGYNFSNGEHLKVWHFGGVEIQDHVEIGGNSCVDIGAFTKTTIGTGTKIDNFCQISHNAKIGKHCVFCGRSGVSGSCRIEDYVVFGAGAGAAPNVYLKTGTQVAACAIISENAIWGPKEVLAGHPAQPLKEYMRTQAKLRILAKK